jgi:hypothetical protein
LRILDSKKQCEVKIEYEINANKDEIDIVKNHMNDRYGDKGWRMKRSDPMGSDGKGLMVADVCN